MTTDEHERQKVAQYLRAREYQRLRDKLLDSIEADINLIRKQLGLQPIDTSGYKEAS